MSDKADKMDKAKVLGTIKVVQRFLSMNKKVVGRDKIYRVLQYTSRFLVWFIPTQTSNAAELVAKLKKLEAHLSMGRKLIRLYKCLDFAVDFESALFEPNPTLRVLSAADSLSKCVRMCFDHIHWAIKVGLLPTWDEKRFGRLANVFWLTGLVAAVSKNYFLLDRAMKREARARKEQQKEVAEKARGEQHMFALAIFRDMCDIPVPLHSLDYLPKVSPGVPAFTGTVASIIGLWEAWNAEAK